MNQLISNRLLIPSKISFWLSRAIVCKKRDFFLATYGNEPFYLLIHSLKVLVDHQIPNCQRNRCDNIMLLVPFKRFMPGNYCKWNILANAIHFDNIHSMSQSHRICGFVILLFIIIIRFLLFCSYCYLSVLELIEFWIL